MSTRPLDATDPATSASVVASAGTGKTWLLVTRMLRLLIVGAEPGGLLAVTFTNRAAGEVQARLMARAREFAVCDAAHLDAALKVIDVAPTADTRAAARALYERLLDARWPPRILTFHTFCRELLAQFPLEAGVAPGFDLLANERELHEAAWDALLDACARDADGAVASALDRLAEGAGGLAGARGRLRLFITHRADWWAWTADAPAPLAHALEAIGALTGVRDDAPWLTDMRRAQIQRFCALVGAAPTAAVAPLLAQLTALLAEDTAAPADWCEALDALTLVEKGKKPRAQLVKKEIARAHGADAAAEVARLQHGLIAASADWQLARLNRDWFTVGERLLDHYQRLKADARVLDFADLEWLACRLLNATDHALWIQYRLDQRVDHVLVDEFQDTNPTQWRMLQPLLAEIAAGDAGRARTAFVVGDPKQAIYGFRRADPRLLESASALLADRLGAPRVRLAGSRRSAQAVLDCVNAVFADGALPLPGFAAHDTFLPDLPGRAEWLHVPAAPEAVGQECDGLRNPLHAPRRPGEELRGLAEATVVAERIRALYDARTPVGVGAAARPLGWDDVMILVRQRTRLPALEQALRHSGIPYASDSRGLLLERPEILDMLALLEFLVAPWNSLQLARLLKSPLFACSDAELLHLAPADPDAQRRGAWYPRLIALAAARNAPASLARAADCLQRWRAHADREPVHDLVDRIYVDGNVLARYHAASPLHLRAAVTANLVQFLDLALEADAGRYPTLHRLVERLEQTRLAAASEREFNDAPVVAAEGRVRVMTIHAAKGLEAPVVFVAQCDLEPREDTLTVQVNWPPDDVRPRWLLLAANRGLDAATAPFRAQQTARAAVEDANLLYVALTRARQYLFVSGMPRDDGWYARLAAVFAAHGAPFDSGRAVAVGTDTPAVSVTPDAALAAVLQPMPDRPSAPDHVDPAAAEHGVLVHAALELDRLDATQARAALARIGGHAADHAAVTAALDTAARVRAAPELGWLFDPAQYRNAWNEARLSADDGDEGERYGVADRLVVTDDEVWVIDYKTHPDPEPRIAWLREVHRPQLERYRALAALLWPAHTVRTALLFTALPRLEVLD